MAFIICMKKNGNLEITMNNPPTLPAPTEMAGGFTLGGFFLTILSSHRIHLWMVVDSLDSVILNGGLEGSSIETSHRRFFSSTRLS